MGQYVLPAASDRLTWSNCRPAVNDDHVIDDVDASVLAMLRSAISERDAAVRFEAPTPAWVSSLKGPCIDLFLHDVVEELGGRGADWTDLRGSDGRVVARQPPLRRYRLHYLVSAWASSAEGEHRLLGRVLRVVVEADNLPSEVLVGSLIEEARHVEVALAEPDPSRLRPHNLWSALGTPPRTSFELVVTAPLRPAPITEVAPPAETISLGVSKELRSGPSAGGTARRSDDAPAQPDLAGGKRWTSFRIRETGAPAGKAPSP
jgi:hypothetical protein